MDKRERSLNLTKHAIAGLPTDRESRVAYHDARVPGLGVMVQPTGNRVFFWFRKLRGRRTWKTLGEFPAMTVEQARDKAQEINALVAKWKASDYEGPSPFEKRGDPTLEKIIEDYIVKHLRAHAKNPERAEAGVRWTAKRYLAPLLNRKMSAIRRDDVRRLHAEIGTENGQVTANRVISFLRTVCYWAIDTELWRGENPARRLELYAEKSRERFLTQSELAALFTALREEPNTDLRDFIILALFTGARRGDVLSMRWQDVSFETHSWRIPDPKGKTPYIVPLMPEAIEVLESRERNGTWVFPSTGRSGHLVSLKRGWQQLVKRLGIRDLRIHDLRRTLGSYMAAQGESLVVIGKALGHQSPAATKVYARLDLTPVREAVQRATRRMLKPKGLERV